MSPDVLPPLYNQGGPAFPIPGSTYLNGMSLRDYFAAQVVATMIHLSSTGDGEWDPATVAHGAYQLADAMLAARSASPEATR